MRKDVTLTLVVLLVGGALAAVARADEPRVNCHKVAEWSDMMVCGNTDLADLDGRVDKAYRQSQEGLSDKDADEVRQVQAAWLKGREKCQKDSDPTKCLQDYYQDRIKKIVQPQDNDDDE